MTQEHADSAEHHVADSAPDYSRHLRPFAFFALTLASIV
jgi:hypothetical protein